MKAQKPVHFAIGMAAVLFSTGSFANARSAGVTEAAARRAALEAFPGEVTEAETEREKGKQVFVFDVRQVKEDGTAIHAEVVVDAESGAVLAVETEGDAADEEGEAGEGDGEGDDEDEDEDEDGDEGEDGELPDAVNLR